MKRGLQLLEWVLAKKGCLTVPFAGTMQVSGDQKSAVISTEAQHALLTFQDFVDAVGTDLKFAKVRQGYLELFQALNIIPDRETATSFPCLSSIPLLAHTYDKLHDQDPGKAVAKYCVTELLPKECQLLFPDFMQYIKENLVAQVVELNAFTGKDLREVSRTPDGFELKSGGHREYKFIVNKMEFWVSKPKSPLDCDVGFCVDQAISSHNPTDSFKITMIELFKSQKRVMFNVRGLGNSGHLEQLRGCRNDGELRKALSTIIGGGSTGGGHQYCFIVDHAQRKIVMINDNKIAGHDDALAFRAQIDEIYKQLVIKTERYALKLHGEKSRPDGKIAVNQSCCVSQFLHWCALQSGIAPDQIEGEIPGHAFGLLYAYLTAVRTPNDDLKKALADLLSSLQQEPAISDRLQQYRDGIAGPAHAAGGKGGETKGESPYDAPPCRRRPPATGNKLGGNRQGPGTPLLGPDPQGQGHSSMRSSSSMGWSWCRWLMGCAVDNAEADASKNAALLGAGYGAAGAATAGSQQQVQPYDVSLTQKQYNKFYANRPAGVSISKFEQASAAESNYTINFDATVTAVTADYVRLMIESLQENNANSSKYST